ncbi:PREDICTED: mitogen-activated protein kinase kinase 7 [Theobroma cacao]|uniref:Mitogen-activated protein kinase kinase 7 n=1 Tax=Theobroma cacao TaxID=3641 RepID=A0AB32WFA2_THECC|nr:PREDICTED: mitogen-activated protein kinase kinase 7 [Theobroma cacao]
MEVKGVRIRVLGKGTYGVVYLLKTNIPTSQLYAVKSADEEMASTLHKEQEILQQFSGCPNIVRCFGGFTSVECGRKIFNLFLEYASRGCLADLMKEYGGKIPERHAKFYARMILEGLVDIHRKGYIHSDLKPRNILVFPSQDGISLDTLKIADFGLVKKYGVKDTNDWEYGFRGTAPYMSPESIIGYITGALDIWSLGCIMVEMLTGKLPLAFRNLKDLRDKLLRGESPNIPANMSSMGKNFLIKCFARDPNERWTASMLLSHPYLLPEHTFSLPVTGFLQCNPSLASINFQVAEAFHSPKGYELFPSGTRKILDDLFRMQLIKQVTDMKLGVWTGVFAPTIHRNVKCSNILLTESLHAKLSDFRLSKAFTLEGDSHVYTVVADTPGYVDPDKVVVFMYQ